MAVTEPQAMMPQAVITDEMTDDNGDQARTP